jgi:hypothetical protein
VKLDLLFDMQVTEGFDAYAELTVLDLRVPSLKKFPQAMLRKLLHLQEVLDHGY